MASPTRLTVKVTSTATPPTEERSILDTVSESVRALMSGAAVETMADEVRGSIYDIRSHYSVLLL